MAFGSRRKEVKGPVQEPSLIRRVDFEDCPSGLQAIWVHDGMVSFFNKNTNTPEANTEANTQVWSAIGGIPGLNYQEATSYALDKGMDVPLIRGMLPADAVKAVIDQLSQAGVISSTNAKAAYDSMGFTPDTLAEPARGSDKKSEGKKYFWQQGG